MPLKRNVINPSRTEPHFKNRNYQDATLKVTQTITMLVSALAVSWCARYKQCAISLRIMKTSATRKTPNDLYAHFKNRQENSLHVTAWPIPLHHRTHFLAFIQTQG